MSLTMKMVVAGLMVITPFIAAQERPADIQLGAALHKQEKAIQITLRNTGHNTYLLSIGGLCGPYGTPAFRFSVSGEAPANGVLFLDYNPMPVSMPCGASEPWTVILTEGAEYGFTFRLNHLRLRRHLRTSLEELIDKQWKLTVGYRGHVDSQYLARWNAIYRGVPPRNTFPKPIPFWAGTLSATVVNRP